MPPIARIPSDRDQCECCAYLMRGETGLRCGYRYFQRPAMERKVERLSSFPLVQANQHCARWTPK
jgi:hypothetical protein